MNTMVERNWLRRGRDHRVLELTGAGREAVTELLGLRLAAEPAPGER